MLAQPWAAVGMCVGSSLSMKAGCPRVRQPDAHCWLWAPWLQGQQSRAQGSCPRPGQAARHIPTAPGLRTPPVSRVSGHSPVCLNFMPLQLPTNSISFHSQKYLQWGQKDVVTLPAGEPHPPTHTLHQNISRVLLPRTQECGSLPQTTFGSVCVCF